MSMLPPDARNWCLAPEAMAAVDRAAMVYGLSGAAMMESAGRGVAEAVVERWGSRGRARVLVGKGNNGGDGLVTARTLTTLGWEVEIALFAEPAALEGDAAEQWRAVESLALPVERVLSEDDARRVVGFEDFDCVVDALLGTGLSGDVREPIRAAIDALNAGRVPVASVDVPSGLDGARGRPLGVAVRATETITFGFPKPGLFLAEGPDHTGRLVVVPLGYPEAAFDALTAPPVEWTVVSDVASTFARPPRAAHKGSRGRLLLVTGSEAYRGAALLTARAALRSGCGYCVVAAPEPLAEFIVGQLPEAIVEPLAADGDGAVAAVAAERVQELAEGADAIAIGPGLSTAAGVRAVVESALESSVPIVVDADALNALADRPPAIERTADTVLTPHPGELARWLGRDAQAVDAERIVVAAETAEHWGVDVVLKGWPTIIAGNGRVGMNLTGNPGLATGGSGDVLTGVIGALLAQGSRSADATRAGVFVHGLAADWAAADFGERSLIPTDLEPYLPRTMQALASGGAATILDRIDHPYRTLLAR